MEPGVETQVGAVLEDAGSRPFTVAVRGYDRQQVDGFISELEERARQGRLQAEAAGRELAQAREQFGRQERPGYAGLGSRIEQLLALAEAQATELLQEAKAAAGELIAAAKVEAAGIRATAETEAAGLRAAAKQETDDLRGATEGEADAARASAQREASELTATIGRHAAQLQAAAEHEVAAKRGRGRGGSGQVPHHRRA